MGNLGYLDSVFIDKIMSVARSRIFDLLKVQCRIFSHTYNPERLRTGNKVLRERLRGPAVAAYYPPRNPTMKDLVTLYPDMETWDEDEEDRLESIAAAKQRGKGAPKKKRTAEQSKKFAHRKKKKAA